MPYQGTEGWIDEATSRDRAEGEMRRGVARIRRVKIVNLLLEVGGDGATWKEVAEAVGVHHGQASASLSALHREGKVCRLTERRNGCSVYVHRYYVAGRDVIPPRSNRRTQDVAEALGLIDVALGMDGWEDGQRTLIVAARRLLGGT
jgi:hypothetical protein